MTSRECSSARKRLTCRIYHIILKHLLLKFHFLARYKWYSFYNCVKTYTMCRDCQMCGRKEGKQGLRPEGGFLESIQLVSVLQLLFYLIDSGRETIWRYFVLNCIIHYLNSLYPPLYGWVGKGLQHDKNISRIRKKILILIIVSWKVLTCLHMSVFFCIPPNSQIQYKYFIVMFSNEHRIQP